MKHTETVYGVMITSKDGTKFLAIGPSSTRFTARSRTIATSFAIELRKHIGAKTKVVKLRATYQVIERKKKV